jgi:hypothetical protein
MAGLKTLAKELQSKGRNGDTILAHINPQEAGILKALGGSGTRNPATGLPEYLKIGNPFRAAQSAVAFVNPFNPGSGLNKGINQIPIVGDINKAANQLGTQIFQPIEKAIVQPASKGLSEFDKQVARTVPGGWATVAQVAASMVPGGQPLAIGIGAARGAGLTRTGSSLQRADLKGAVIGGATAYASAELGDYMRGAVPPGTEGTTQSLTEAVAKEAAPELLNSVPYEGAVSQAGYYPSVDPGYYDVPSTMSTSPNFDPGYADVSSSVNVPPPPPPVVATPPLVQLGGPGTTGYTVTDYLKSGDLGAAANQVGSNIYDTGANALQNVQDFGNKVITPETYTEGIPNVLGKGYEGVSNTASGAKNLLGLGDISRNEAIKLAAKTGIDPIKMAGIVIAGESTLAGMEEQRKYLEEAKRANAISQAEYDRAMASIYSQRDYAADVVSKNPLTIPDIDVSGLGSSNYQGSSNLLYPTSSKTLYAMGGSVDDELGGDYSAMGMDQGNLQKGLFGMGYATGGMPRFLSGGGDGMSDSIKATINDNQPARLADGEFVIPADVVSHLGNGSSKAGAKQLYSMMDKIRKARTGNSKQGKQINPRKYIPA